MSEQAKRDAIFIGPALVRINELESRIACIAEILTPNIIDGLLISFTNGLTIEVCHTDRKRLEDAIHGKESA